MPAGNTSVVLNDVELPPGSVHVVVVTAVSGDVSRSSELEYITICKMPQTLSSTIHTGELLNKGHYGANNFVPCREVVPISEVNNILEWG